MRIAKRIRNPGGQVGRPSNTVEKFKTLIEQRGPDECWRWRGTINSNGYGFYKLWGKYRLAHRLSVIFLKGEDPTGKVVRHTCDNPLCVNPEHLLIGTTQDNVNDRVTRNRSATGERNFNTKLTLEQVLIIKKSDFSINGTGRDLAKQFGVTQTTISRIKLGKAYKYVSTDITTNGDHPKEDEAREEVFARTK